MKDSFGIVLFVLCMVSSLILVDSNRFADPDLFCHLYSGREIVQGGTVPHTDSDSFSVPGGRWIDYEWGTRVIFYLLYISTGSAGLVVFRILISLAIFALLFATSMKLSGSVLYSSLSTILGAAASFRYFLFRPQLITFLLVSLLIMFLVDFSQGRKRGLFFVPLLFFLWANLHAGFPIALAILALFIVSKLVSELFSVKIFQSSRGSARNLILIGIFVLSLLVTLINPFGIGLWKGIFGTVFGSFTPELSEWKPAYTFPFMRLFWYYAFLAIFIVSYIARKKRELLPCLLFLFLAYLSVSRVRFIPLFALVLAPFLADNLSALRERFHVRKRGVAAGAFTLLIVLLPLIVKGSQGEIHLHLRIFKTDFYQPVAAVKIMKDNGLAGNVMNDYDWGGYIHWELPASRIFVDGRSDTVYPKKVIDEWAYFISGRDGWDEILRKYGADSILIRTQQPVVERLKRSDVWKAVYYDDICTFYLNIESSKNASFLKKWLSDSLITESLSKKDYLL